MDDSMLDFQTINSLQNTLITIEIALKNKTMSHESAQKHISLVLKTVNIIEKNYYCEDTVELAKSVKKLAKDLLKNTEIQLPGYER